MTDQAHIPNTEPEPEHEGQSQSGIMVCRWIARAAVIFLGIAVGCVLAVIIALSTGLIQFTC